MTDLDIPAHNWDDLMVFMARPGPRGLFIRTGAEYFLKVVANGDGTFTMSKVLEQDMTDSEREMAEGPL